MIGYAMCGSFCTLEKSLKTMRELRSLGYELEPIMSEIVYSSDTRFGKSEYFKKSVTEICQRPIIHSIIDAEPIGPKNYLDLLIIAPCTGNTLAKMANGITDTAVTMAAKAHLRGNRPLVIALASNDALSANLKNIGTMLTRRSVYFVPMAQDDPSGKPHSLVADFTKLAPTLEAALQGKQHQPIFC